MQTNSLLYMVTTAGGGCSFRCGCSLGTVEIPADSLAEIPGGKPAETGLDCRTKSRAELATQDSIHLSGLRFGADDFRGEKLSDYVGRPLTTNGAFPNSRTVDTHDIG